MYQRAFYTAQALDLVGKTHDAMFDATWKTGELSTCNLKASGLKPQAAWPTIEDVAKFYPKFGVDPPEFIGVANSFSVNTNMKRADDLRSEERTSKLQSLIRRQSAVRRLEKKQNNNY